MMKDQQFLMLVGGIVGLGLIGGLVLTMGGSQPSDGISKKEQRAIEKAEKERVMTVATDSIKMFNETRMALQSCRDFDLRDRFVENNQIRFSAWNSVRRDGSLLDKIAKGEVSDAELTALKRNGRLAGAAIEDVGGQLAGLGYGLSYDAGSDKCKDLIRDVRKGKRDLPYVGEASEPAVG